MAAGHNLRGPRLRAGTLAKSIHCRRPLRAKSKDKFVQPAVRVVDTDSSALIARKSDSSTTTTDYYLHTTFLMITHSATLPRRPLSLPGLLSRRPGMTNFPQERLLSRKRFSAQLGSPLHHSSVSVSRCNVQCADRNRQWLSSME